MMPVIKGWPDAALLTEMAGKKRKGKGAGRMGSEVCVFTIMMLVCERFELRPGQPTTANEAIGEVSNDLLE